MSRTRICCWLSVLAVIVSFSADAPIAEARRIEAKKGKKYRLTKQHGPWMIMVASLKDIPPTVREVQNGKSVTVANSRYKDGVSAEEAADLLVYSLRKKGIPAYTYHQSAVEESINTVDRLGNRQRRTYTALQDRVCVIAGNYPSIKDRIAQKTLKYIKSYSPDEWKNNAFYRPTRGRPKPLSGAIMTINPKLSLEEVSQRKLKPLLLRLNTGQPFTLLSNKGQYTLAVASFRGTTKTRIGGNFLANDKSASNDPGDRQDLYDAGASAVALAEHLRSGNYLANTKQPGDQSPVANYRQGSRFEAYVYHEQHRSIVTVGSFDSANDPRLKNLIDRFQTKIAWGQSGQLNSTPEYITVHSNVGKKRTEQRTFIFDPKPQVMKVPRLR